MSPASNFLDRRLPRVELDAPVSLLQPPGADESTGTVTNLSEGGVFIKTPGEFEIGSKLNLRFPLGGSDLEVGGLVRWHGGHAERGVGIEFVDLTDGTRARIRAWTETGEQPVRVRFAGMGKAARASARREGDRLVVTTSMPFLRRGALLDLSLADEAESQWRIRDARLDTRSSVARLEIEVECDNLDAVPGAVDIPESDTQRTVFQWKDADLESPAWVESVPVVHDSTAKVVGPPRNLPRQFLRIAIAIATCTLLVMLLARGDDAPATAEVAEQGVEQTAIEPPAPVATSPTGSVVAAAKAAMAKPPTTTAPAPSPKVGNRVIASTEAKAKPALPTKKPSSASRPRTEEFDGFIAEHVDGRTTATLALKMPVDSPRHYRLATPEGVAINLPAGSIETPLGIHALSDELVSKLWLREYKDGVQLRLLFRYDDVSYSVKTTGNALIISVGD